MGVVSGTGGCGQFYDVIRILVGVSIVWENETNEQTAEHHDSPCMHRASILCFIYTVVYMFSVYSNYGSRFNMSQLMLCYFQLEQPHYCEILYQCPIFVMYMCM